MWEEWHYGGWQRFREYWWQTLAAVTVYSFALSQVALAVIGGNVIAGERADRSAEFQIYLPLPRTKILAAKLLLVLAIAAVVWAINPFVAWIALSLNTNEVVRISFDLPPILFFSAITGLVFFCVAWFFSTVLRSPTFSVVAGLSAPAIIFSLILFVNYLLRGELSIDSRGMDIYAALSVAVAIASFAVGTWLFLRRIEP
jgi:ABC-type transport system involved in multi-copper enzyme maturation permease subunit